MSGILRRPPAGPLATRAVSIGDLPGQRIVSADAWGTVAFAVTSIAAAVAPGWFAVPALVAALGLFAAGIGIFFAGYATAVQRSREVEIGIGGLFFLAGSAPKAVRVRLLGLLAVQVVLAFATASARPFSSLAFGMLVPIYGLAFCGLWGARHGTFGPRQVRGPQYGGRGPGRRDDG